LLTPQDPHGTPSVGARLSAARNARGLSLSDAERQTRIARRFLQAMEADQFDVLPAPVYARGFLRNYARFLGLDEKELLAGVSLGEQRPHVLPVVPQRSNPVLWMVAGVAFGAGVLLWVFLGLGVLGSIEGLIDDIDLDGEPAAPTPIVATQTPAPSCDDLEGRESLSAEEQAFFSANCATPTPPGPTPVSDRTSCDEIRGTDYRSDAERSFFLENCLTPAPG
jgi:Helix-turn-helix domain